MPDDMTKDVFYNYLVAEYNVPFAGWDMPYFSVEKYFDKLVEIDELIERDGFVDVLFQQFFVVARKV